MDWTLIVLIGIFGCLVFICAYLVDEDKITTERWRELYSHLDDLKEK